MPLLRASAMSFVWPTTVSRHFGLLAFACMAVFGVEWSFIRRDDSILSHSTSFGASNSAFLAVASWSGISQHGSFTRVYCPVALEFFHCSAFLCLRFLCVFTQLLGLSCAGFCVLELWCFLRISNFVSSPLFGWIPRFGLLFPSLCVLIGLCGGSFYCSALYTPQTFTWFLVLAPTCFMVLLLPRAGLHAMLSEVQVSTQHVIAVMLVNVSRSSEVALDALQHSAFVLASGNAEQFMLLFSAAITITVFLCLSNQFSGCMYTDHLQELGLALFSFFCLLSAQMLSASDHVGVSTYHGTNHGHTRNGSRFTSVSMYIRVRSVCFT